MRFTDGERTFWCRYCRKHGTYSPFTIALTLTVKQRLTERTASP